MAFNFRKQFRMTQRLPNLHINADRMWADIHDTAKFGGTPKGGVRRLTLSEEDRQVRDWFRAACEAAGCEVHVDALGSIFAIRPGRDKTKLPVGVGSHLDTQPTGGKFDGILGVLSGLEVIRTLNDAGIETEAPICLVNWTNEEGSRFAPAMMASGVYANMFKVEDILARKDAEGVTVSTALDQIGYRGSEPVGTCRLGAFVELHIEQGPILEREQKTIGVVERGQGVLWYDGHITGMERHAATPMEYRQDAMAALAEIVLAAEKIAKAHAPNAVATVGEAVIAAPSRNVVPGEIAFTMDVRSPDNAIMTALDSRIREAIAEIAERRQAEITFDNVWHKPVTMFNEGVIGAVQQATTALGYSNRRITSGAGHDACNLNEVIPTAMIFVPCKDGISHNEVEDATKDDCAAGANVLLHATLSLAGIASS
jgi:N-carbamoyl-L-amino-acid hydrolase